MHVARALAVSLGAWFRGWVARGLRLGRGVRLVGRATGWRWLSFVAYVRGRIAMGACMVHCIGGAL